MKIQVVLVVLLGMVMILCADPPATDAADAPNNQEYNKLMEEYEKVYSGDFLFRKIQGDDAYSFQTFTFYINKYGVYYTQVGKQDVIDMIRFDEIVNQDEYNKMVKSYKAKNNPDQRQVNSQALEISCCKNIEEPAMNRLYKNNNDQSSLLCMFLDDPEFKMRWQICDLNFMGVEEYLADERSVTQKVITVTRFYKQTVEQVQRYIQIREGIVNVEVPVSLTSNSPSQEVKLWSYQSQDTWEPSVNCAGSQQSPIDLKSENVLYSTRYMQVKFNFQGDQYTYLVKGVNQNYLMGNFGKTTLVDYENHKNPLEYHAFRIEIHFESEHQVQGKKYDAEILVYHSLSEPLSGDELKKQYSSDLTIDSESRMVSDKTDMILSFLVSKDGLRSTNDDGYFWSSFASTKPLSIENMLTGKFEITPIVDDEDARKQNIKLHVMARDQLFNLEALVKGGLINKFKKSFFHYKGSFSIPDCSQVDRIVMSSVITISETSYKAAEDIIKQEKDTSNSRTIKNSDDAAQMAQYSIRYHVDTSDICDSSNLQLEKFINYDFQSSNSQETAQYQKIIKMITEKQKTLREIQMKYSQITGEKDPNQQKEEDEDKSEQEKYQYEKSTRQQYQSTITTNIDHIHQVPAHLVKKIYKKDADDLLIGYSKAKVGSLDVTFMGTNAKQYAASTTKYKDAGYYNQQKQVVDDVNKSVYGNKMPKDNKEFQNQQGLDKYGEVHQNMKNVKQLLDQNTNKENPVNQAIEQQKKDLENQKALNKGQDQTDRKRKKLRKK